MERFPPRCASLFRPERPLAAGAFGVVFLATQIALNRRVVVKLLRSHRLTDPEQHARFQREARVTARLSHPNVVVLIDHDVEENIPWIAYEYLEGKTLFELLSEGLPDMRTALEAARDVAAALEAVHAAGVLHRDVKASNVIRTLAGPSKLCDFGLAKWAEADGVKTRTGQVMGTPLYMAPEVLMGSPATERSDLYALGLLTYQLLTGRLPFPELVEEAVIRWHIKDRCPPPSQARAEVPGEVDELVLHAVAKQPAERIASATLVRKGLDKALADLGRPRSPAERGTRPHRGASAHESRSRRPDRALPALLVALTLVAVAVLHALVSRTDPAGARPQPSPSATPSPTAAPGVEAVLGPVTEALLRFHRNEKDLFEPQEACLQPGDEKFARASELAARLEAEDAHALRVIEQAIGQLTAGATSRASIPDDVLSALHHLASWRFVVWIRREHAATIHRIADRLKKGAVGIPELHDQLSRTWFRRDGIGLLRESLSLAHDVVARVDLDSDRWLARLDRLLDGLHQAGKACVRARWDATCGREMKAASGGFLDELPRANPDASVSMLATAFWRWGLESIHGRGVRHQLDQSRWLLAGLGRRHPPADATLSVLTTRIERELAMTSRPESR